MDHFGIRRQTSDRPHHKFINSLYCSKMEFSGVFIQRLWLNSHEFYGRIAFLSPNKCLNRNTVALAIGAMELAGATLYNFRIKIGLEKCCDRWLKMSLSHSWRAMIYTLPTACDLRPMWARNFCVCARRVRDNEIAQKCWEREEKPQPNIRKIIDNYVGGCSHTSDVRRTSLEAIRWHTKPPHCCPYRIHSYIGFGSHTAYVRVLTPKRRNSRRHDTAVVSFSALDCIDSCAAFLLSSPIGTH